MSRKTYTLLAITTLLLTSVACSTQQYAHNVHWAQAEQHWQAYLASDNPKTAQYHLERARYFDQIAAIEYQIELQGWYNNRSAIGAGAAAATLNRGSTQNLQTCATVNDILVCP